MKSVDNFGFRLPDNEILLPGLSFEDHQKVLAWCFERGIKVSYYTMYFDNESRTMMTRWAVEDMSMFMLFVLRWGR